MTILRRPPSAEIPPARRRSWRKILSGASAGAIVAGTLRSRKSPGANPKQATAHERDLVLQVGEGVAEHADHATTM